MNRYFLGSYSVGVLIKIVQFIVKAYFDLQHTKGCWQVKKYSTFAGVYFKGSIRSKASTQKMDTYNLLVKSYPNEDGRVCHRTILYVGFIEGATADLLKATQAHLGARFRSQDTLFCEADLQDIASTAEMW